MLVICGFKIPMFAHNQIGLYGTSEQMKATENIWKDSGHKVTGRQPGHAYSINVDKPKKDWIDKQPPVGQE